MASAARSSGVLPLVLLVVALTFALQCLAPAFVGSSQLQHRQGNLRSPVVLSAATPSTMDKVADIVAEQLGVDKSKVVGTATLSELGADSLDIVEAVMALEEGFDVELPDEETTTLKNIQDVGDLIESKL